MPAGSANRPPSAWFDSWSAGSIWLLIAGTALVLITFDRIFPAVGMGPVYIPLIALAGWRLGLASACAVALVAVFLNIFPHHADEAVAPAVALVRGTLRLGTYAFIVALVCALRRSYDRERTASRRDYLTGALTRASFDEHAAIVLHPAVLQRGAIAIGLIDVDRFKSINDLHGHAAGDDALRLLVQTARTILYRDDCLSRLGGDEFAVILSAASVEEARSRADAFHRSISNGLARGRVVVTASMGVCILAPGASADAASALRQADRLMYEAKASGPGGIRSETFTRAYPAMS